MTDDDFRRIALGMNGAVEGAHMGHPDFRANGRIFATLRPELASGMVSLTPEQQQQFIQSHPAVFSPEVGAWGRAGATRVLLAVAEEEPVGEAVTLAWRNVMAKLPKKGSKDAKETKDARGSQGSKTGSSKRGSTEKRPARK
jgi:hypothetical protein